MIAKKLRNSVLQLAVQGRLVPQDPADEPAAVVLEKIRAEKRALVRAGKLRKAKGESTIFRGSARIKGTEPGRFYEKDGAGKIVDITDSLPFAIPENWEWVRLGEVGRWKSGLTPSRDKPLFYNGDIAWVKTGDLNDGYLSFTSEKITHEAVDKTNIVINPPGSVLIAMYGATIGKLGILKIHAATNQACCACVPNILTDKKYLFYYLLSIRQQLIRQAVGGAQPNISKEKIVTFPLPLPPYAEQERIVSALDALLPKISEYEESETKIHQIKSSFPEKLKKSVLQTAIQGKLVPQDPADEPARVLLEKIRANRLAFIKKGKIKKPKIESSIFKRDGSWFEKCGKSERCIDEEIPYNIPKSWAWERLGNLFRLQAGKFIAATEISNFQTENSYPCFGGNGIRGYVNKYNNDGNYAIIGRQGALCGNINIAQGKFYATEHAVVVYPFFKADINWIKYFLLALNLNQYATATAQPGLAVSKVLNILFPLPPQNEQRNIASKIAAIAGTSDKWSNIF